MSGHSKWSTIKHKKAAADAKKGQAFTMLGKAISIAAREGGGDEETNFSLRLAVEKARKASMPLENIERAINRGTGDGSGSQLDKATYGGYGAEGVAVAVDVLTDNKNRTVSELRSLFSSHGGTLAEASSVLWQFTQRGKVIVKCAVKQKSEKYGEEDKDVEVDRDEVMMEVMDIDGVIDVSESDYKPNEDEPNSANFKYCDVLTDVKVLAKVRDDISQKGYIIEDIELIRVPENMINVTEKGQSKIINLLEALGENEDVESVFVNAEI